MARLIDRIFFDRQDRDILVLVNRILEAPNVPSRDNLFNPELHPHGIKELVTSPASRMAYAVINLLRNLEVGGSRDRLLALQTLYDEVLTSAHSALRRNTARALMQIMKDMVRAHGDETRQLMLAHDFRNTALGTPRVVRRMLARYHLPEMPEAWNQLAFDDHVYDVNTKGRKTPTHLIMDAWIKGLRSITVVYDNSVDLEAATEVIHASGIVGISVRIGLEFSVPFYDRFVNLVWMPRGFSSGKGFLDFLRSPQMREMLEKGREVLHWRREVALHTLEVWNEDERPRLEQLWGVSVAPMGLEEFLDFVGRGHASLLRLAEYLHKHIQLSLRARAEILRARHDDPEAMEELRRLDNLGPDDVQALWLNHGHNPRIPNTEQPGACDNLPELMCMSAQKLSAYLNRLATGNRLILGTEGLSVEDVVELLWDCEGRITHLELFNMKSWVEGHLNNIAAINELQRVLNQGLAPRMKQMVRQMIRQMEMTGDDERLEKFHAILRDIPKLWAAYRHEPLKSRLGSNSASRSRSYGMGLAIRETLPRRALLAMKKSGSQQSAIPIYSPVEEQIRYNEPETPSPGQRLLAHFRFLPGCDHLGMERRRVWRAASEDCRVSNRGNMVNLGGLSPFRGNGLTDAPQGEEARPDRRYLNSTLSNCLKVLLGFIPAFCSFQYTQSWWFLAWFGPLIWFSITGVRNVVQMVMAARGAKRSTLTHWREHVSVKRICDSLMYTGISVLLLEVIMRVLVLEKTFGLSVADHPIVVFCVLNLVNGLYLFSHNMYRGFPRQAAIGNIFRSMLAIPVSALYNATLYHFLLLVLGIPDPLVYLVPSATVISKMASDTVAAIIEGYADSQVNLRMRRWDYESTIKRIFDCYTQLELLFPREDALICLARPGGLRGRGGEEAQRLERILIICALDLMYFWFYQPRAQEAFRHKVRSMAEADRAVLLSAQLVLMREREVSQFLVDGLLGRNFSKPLAFFLDRRKEYLRLMARICILSKPREAPACPVLFGEDKKS